MSSTERKKGTFCFFKVSGCRFDGSRPENDTPVTGDQLRAALDAENVEWLTYMAR